VLIDVSDEVSCHVELLKVRRSAIELARTQYDQTIVGKSQQLHFVVPV